MQADLVRKLGLSAAGLVMLVVLASTQGCQVDGGRRPPVPNSATRTADARSFGPHGVAPDCCSEADQRYGGAYPGPGPYGIICGYVASGLDSMCAWRQRSVGVVDASVGLFSAGEDGQLATSDDQLLATATAGPSGCYELDGIETPGSYVVKIVEPGGAVCDSDNYRFPQVGVARALLDPMALVVTANFGVAP